MAKSNRRRKLDRAKRQARDSQKQVAAGRRLVEQQALDDAIARYDRLLEPSTPVAELAGLLEGMYGGAPVSLFVIDRMLASGSPPERLAEAAEMILAGDDSDGGVPSLTALTFAAEVARATGEAARSRELLDQALAAAADDPGCRIELVNHLRAGGRVAEGIALLESRLRDNPDDARAAAIYGVSIGEVHERVNSREPSDVCSCGQGDGQGDSWHECCGPREHAALSRFADRSGLTAISDAVAAFLVNSAYGSAVDDQVSDLVADYDDLEWKPDELSSVRALLAEHALLTAKLPADDLGDKDHEQDGETVGPLVALAADPSVPREMAARADIWRRHIHYGLWRIDDPSPAPGLLCTDICSGVVRYAEFPVRLTEVLPRWSVWLGGLVPVDGVWRATGTGLRLSPAEADAAAEFVLEASASVMQAVAGKKRRSKKSAQSIRFGRAEPVGVLTDWQDPASPDMAAVIGMVVGVLLARIVGEVHLHRRTPPALRNSDGDEMCLITAEIAVNDSQQVSDKLITRPGFERDPDDPARVIWYGLQIPETQRRGMLAEAKAQLAAQGLALADPEYPAEPQRWVRGTLRVGVGQIVAEVNSDRRLTRLLDVLSEVGAAPTVTDDKRIDPAKDFAWPGAEPAHRRGVAPSGEGWEKYWLDEQVPALRGRTPLEAAQGKERPLLEALLRQFEYEAGLLAAQGQEGIDVAWLRQELDMPDEMAE